MHWAGPVGRSRAFVRPQVWRALDVNYRLWLQAGELQADDVNRLSREITTFDPFWYEEPICPLDAQGHAWLREQLPLKIATGENLYLSHGFEPFWAVRACDYAMPDILRCGGLEQTRQICQAAHAHGVAASPHNCRSSP